MIKTYKLLLNVLEQTAVVRTKHSITEEFQVKKGVRQGCALSPSLFNLYTEKIFREIEDMEGVNVGGHNINNLRYADDMSLLALEEQKLQNLLTTVNDKGKLYGYGNQCEENQVNGS